MTGNSGDANIARFLAQTAREMPDRPAVFVQRDGSQITFAQLEATCNRYANGLSDAGFRRGMRVLVMIKPGLDFIAVTFALLKIGALPVMIDAGMGLRNMLRCIKQVRPEAMIGIAQAHLLRLLRPGAFASVRQVASVGRPWFGGGPSLRQLHDDSSEAFAVVPAAAEDKAAILFTSGSTGPAKGVVYEHGMFDAQLRSLRECYGLERGEIELATFPLFALFCPALGMTCIFPDMDFSRPGRANPAVLVRAINDYQPTNAFGSPALWRRVSEYCVERDLKLSGLRRILLAGAPVDWRLLERLRECVEGATRIYTPYGATESLPVASIGDEEILGDCLAKTRSGGGICVGQPLPGRRVKIIRISDEPIATWSDDLELPVGRTGEIVVSGQVVTKEYFDLPNANALAKIRDGDRIWHRSGDAGYFDPHGRLWYCGRKAHRVVTVKGPLFSVCCEGVFNQHRGVARSALVGVQRGDSQEPVLIIEPGADGYRAPAKRQALSKELLEIGMGVSATQGIGKILFRRSLPVDVRHNAKIDREALAAWAWKELR